MTPTSYYIDYLYLGDYSKAAPTSEEISGDLSVWQPAAVVAVTTSTSRLGRFLIQLFGQPTTHIGSVLGWRLAPGTTAASASSG